MKPHKPNFMSNEQLRSLIEQRSTEHLLQHSRMGWEYANEVKEELYVLLQEILNLLGPDAPECCGCRYEWQKAVDLIKKRLEGK